MVDNRATFESAVAENAGLIVDRDIKPRARSAETLTIVSADNHTEITEDIFYKAFPEHLRDKAPRVVR